MLKGRFPFKISILNKYSNFVNVQTLAFSNSGSPNPKNSENESNSKQMPNESAATQNKDMTKQRPTLIFNKNGTLTLYKTSKHRSYYYLRTPILATFSILTGQTHTQNFSYFYLTISRLVMYGLFTGSYIIWLLPCYLLTKSTLISYTGYLMSINQIDLHKCGTKITIHTEGKQFPSMDISKLTKFERVGKYSPLVRVKGTGHAILNGQEECLGGVLGKVVNMEGGYIGFYLLDQARGDRCVCKGEEFGREVSWICEGGVRLSLNIEIQQRIYSKEGRQTSKLITMVNHKFIQIE